MSLLNVACPDSSLRAEALIDFTTAYAALKRRSSTVASSSMYWGKAKPLGSAFFATFSAAGEAAPSKPFDEPS